MLKADRIKRQKRVREKTRGDKDSPRLSVFRSNRYIFAQAINDDKGETIASISEKSLKEKITKSERAKKLGLLLAEKLKKLKINHIIFDRGAFKYHGRVKALAEGLREGGLKF